MTPKQADSAATAERELLIEAVANALCCEHMGALPGAYSLTHEKDCAKGSESAYMWKSARVAVEAMTAHCAAATAKERQARELAEGEIKDIAKDRLALFRATYAWVADIEAEAGGVGSGNIHGIYCKAKAAVMGSPLYEEMNIAREATNFDTP